MKRMYQKWQEFPSQKTGLRINSFAMKLSLNQHLRSKLIDASRHALPQRVNKDVRCHKKKKLLEKRSKKHVRSNDLSEESKESREESAYRGYNRKAGSAVS